ncbi:MAG TPA: sensor histidine kinase [Microbacteriaceae bacterium]
MPASNFEHREFNHREFDHREFDRGRGHGPGYWRGYPRGSGVRWAPVIISLFTQLIGLGIAIHVQEPFGIAAAAVSAVASFVLLFGRRAPGLTVAVVGLLCAPAIAIVSGPPLAAVPLVFAVVGAVMRSAHVWVWATLAGVALIPGIAWFAVGGNPFGIVRVLFVVIALCLVVALAEAGRSRRERYRTMSRDVAARRQTAEEAERLRIARELHDVLAHSLSQISVQAGVGLHLFDAEPARARQSLEIIKATSSAALDDVRSVLGLLRSGGEAESRSPEPDLAQLDGLIQTAAAGGLTVTIQNRLHTELPSPVQLALYRIVQESLTNVIKHSAARDAAVTLEQDLTRYRAIISDPGPIADRVEPPADRPPGRGLLGMRERAELLGGSLVAGATAEGGFHVVAELPIRAGGVS